MSALPEFGVGTSIVFEERWRSVLWTAVPHRVITSSPTLLVGWVPFGARSVYATNRGLAETVGLTREERKLLALKTGNAVAAEFAETPAKLCVYRPGRWSRINLGFDVDGGFLGWYVDFELPVRSTPYGLESKDLVLDLWIDPDRYWHWKDRDDFERAIDQGLVPDEARAELQNEADLVLSELAERSGPFSSDYSGFVPDASWEPPMLPPAYAWDGSEWTLTAGPRA